VESLAALYKPQILPQSLIELYYDKIYYNRLTDRSGGPQSRWLPPYYLFIIFFSFFFNEVPLGPKWMPLSEGPPRSSFRLLFCVLGKILDLSTNIEG